MLLQTTSIIAETQYQTHGLHLYVYILRFRSIRKLQWKFVENSASYCSVRHRYPSSVNADRTMCIHMHIRNNYNNNDSKCNNALGPLVELEIGCLGPRTRTSSLIFSPGQDPPSTRVRKLAVFVGNSSLAVCLKKKNKFLVLLFFCNDWTPVAREHRVWNSNVCREARRHTAITYKRIFVFRISRDIPFFFVCFFYHHSSVCSKMFIGMQHVCNLFFFIVYRGNNICLRGFVLTVFKSK